MAKSDFLQRVGLHLGVPQTWPHYHQMLMYHRWMDPQVPEGAVLFIGDSITQGLAVSAVTPHGVNYGIGGDNVPGVAQRILHYGSLTRASAVVLAIGINDLSWRDDERVLEDYARLLAAIPSGPRVIVSAVLPVASPTAAIDLPAAEERIANFNERLQALAESRGTRFVPAPPALADATGRLRPEQHLGDGLHLSPSGYRLWIDALRTALAAAPSQSSREPTSVGEAPSPFAGVSPSFSGTPAIESDALPK